MKLWCMLVILFILTISISYIYSDESMEKFYPVEKQSSKSQSTFVQDHRSRIKRSQRNANVLYRYCRQGGHRRQFCLKYAVQMLYATGH